MELHVLKDYRDTRNKITFQKRFLHFLNVSANMIMAPFEVQASGCFRYALVLWLTLMTNLLYIQLICLVYYLFLVLHLNMLAQSIMAVFI